MKGQVCHNLELVPRQHCFPSILLVYYMSTKYNFVRPHRALDYKTPNHDTLVEIVEKRLMRMQRLIALNRGKLLGIAMKDDIIF